MKCERCYTEFPNAIRPPEHPVERCIELLLDTQVILRLAGEDLFRELERRIADHGSCNCQACAALINWKNRREVVRPAKR